MVLRLGNVTWACDDASGICFVGNELLAVTDFEGGFQIFEQKSAKRLAGWSAKNEQLNCLTHDGQETFFVGGSFGILYSLTYRNGSLQLLDQREVLHYFDLVEYAPEHDVFAAVCETDLRVVPRRGQEIIRNLTFPGRIRSVQWSSRLNTFLVVADKGLYAVNPDGDRTLLLQRESRLLAAAYDADRDRFTVLTGVSDNDAVLQAVNRSSRSLDWEQRVLLDHSSFATIYKPREWDCGSLHVVPQTGNVVVSGLNWLARYDATGQPIGEQIKLRHLLNTVAVSSTGVTAAAFAMSAGLYVYDESFQPVMPRDCHYEGVADLTFLGGETLLVSSSGEGSEVICWDLKKESRLWARAFGGYWCDGLFSVGPDDDLHLAASTSESTTLYSVSPETGEVQNQRRIDGNFRVRVQRMECGDLTLAPSWEYGPGGIAGLADWPTLESTIRLTAGEYRLFPVAANEEIIVAADSHHLWWWDRSAPLHPRDLEMPGETFSGVPPILSVIPIAKKSFIAISYTGAYSFTGPDLRRKTLIEFETKLASVSQPVQGQVVLGFRDGRAEVRSLPQFNLAKSWMAHNGSGVTASVLSRDASLIATGAGDGTIAVWRNSGASIG